MHCLCGRARRPSDLLVRGVPPTAQATCAQTRPDKDCCPPMVLAKCTHRQVLPASGLSMAWRVAAGGDARRLAAADEWGRQPVGQGHADAALQHALHACRLPAHGRAPHPGPALPAALARDWAGIGLNVLRHVESLHMPWPDVYQLVSTLPFTCFNLI